MASFRTVLDRVNSGERDPFRQYCKFVILPSASTTSTAIAPFRRRLSKPLAGRPVAILRVGLKHGYGLTYARYRMRTDPGHARRLSTTIYSRLVRMVRRFPRVAAMSLANNTPRVGCNFQPLIRTTQTTNGAIVIHAGLAVFFRTNCSSLPSCFTRRRVRIITSLPYCLRGGIGRRHKSKICSTSVHTLR